MMPIYWRYKKGLKIRDVESRKFVMDYLYLKLLVHPNHEKSFKTFRTVFFALEQYFM